LISLPEGPGVTHRVLPESGVIVIELTEPLRPIFRHPRRDGRLLAGDARRVPGVVLHARAFPGWENIGGLLRHVRFVRDHHRTVRRVVLATDTKLADLLPRLTEHFVQAELRHFGYDELDGAIAWAAGRHGRRAATSAVEPQIAPSNA
jgi:hypothetical protein